eukprot:710907-Lingulodinium_polyedra.AAC.1
MREVALFACEEPLQADREIKATLHTFACQALSGWGQTKIVEDSLKELRDSEARDVTNKKLELARQWALLNDRNTIALHGRVEVAPASSVDNKEDSLDMSVFSPVNTVPSIPADSLVQVADWPTLSAQTFQVLAAENALLAHCHASSSFEEASLCWQCVL